MKCAVAVKFAKSNLVRAIKDSVYIKSLLVFCLDDSITVTLSHRVARIRRVLRGKLNGWKTTEDDDDKNPQTPGIPSRTCKRPPAFLLFPRNSALHKRQLVQIERNIRATAALQPNFYVEFECRNLRLGEDPADFKWKLENLLAKADLHYQPTQRRL